MSTLLGTRTALRVQTCTATDIVLSGSVVVKVKKEDRAQALSGREAEARTSPDLATVLTGAKARRPSSFPTGDSSPALARLAPGSVSASMAGSSPDEDNFPLD